MWILQIFCIKTISGRMLLEKPWISLKMAPTAIPVNIYYWLSKRIRTLQFFEVCLRQIRGYFYGNFYQSFSCTLVFFALNRFQVNCLSLSSCFMLKRIRPGDISVKKKISHKIKSSLKTCHINASWKPNFMVF